MVVLASVAGCAAPEDAVGIAEGELGATPTEAGLAEGSIEEEGIILLVNDREMTAEAFESRTTLDRSVAKAIVDYRVGPDGAPRWFTNLDEIDALPDTEVDTFQRLLADARTEGYVEAPGFDPPLMARLSIPDNLGRPPTANDVTVEAGFDGKSPADVLKLVRSRLTNSVHSSNESFINKTIRDNHKAFTIAIGNLFAANSPHATFARNLQADRLTMLGTVSALNPTIIKAEKAGATTYYARGAGGTYQQIDTPRYPILMRARIRLGATITTDGAGNEDAGQGVRVFYPPWSAKVLTGPTTVIIEGNP